MEGNTQVFKKTNGFSIAGLICSLVVGSLTGIIFSAIGLSKANEYNSGKGLAIAGLVISILRIVFSVIMAVVFFTLVWPNTRQDILRSTYCSQAYECRSCTTTECTCKYRDSDNKVNTITCPRSK